MSYFKTKIKGCDRLKIYVPEDNTFNKCYIVQSEGVIRGYEETPQVNRTINYRDYYIKSDYIYKDGSQTFSSYSTPPSCLSSNVITNDFYYRNDIANILIIFLILVIFCIYAPVKLFMRLIRG